MTKIMVINNVCIAHDSSRYPLGCLEGILKPSPPSAGHPVMDQPAQFQVLYMCFIHDLPLHLHILCPYNVPYPEPPLFDYKRQKSVIHMPPSPHPLNMTIAKSNQLHPLSFFWVHQHHSRSIKTALAQKLSPELLQYLPNWPSGILCPPTTPHSSSQTGHWKCKSSHATHICLYTGQTPFKV